MSRVKTPFYRLKPKELNEAAWREVVDSWENGLSDREASFRASKDTGMYVTEIQLKEILNKYPDVLSLKDHLHSAITSKAKLNIKEDIDNGNVATSKWYLERKAADEFSTKGAIAFEGAVVELSLEEKQKEMQEFMKQFGASEDESE